MARENILIDTSLLIDYFRKKKKEKTEFVRLSEDYNLYASSITRFEILRGATESQKPFWEKVFKLVTVIPLTDDAIDFAISEVKYLKSQNKLIGLADLFIASTALASNLPIATFNKKHFERVRNLVLIPLNPTK